MRKMLLASLILLTAKSNAQFIGIGTNSPSHLLHVTSGIDPVRIEGIQSGAATDSVVTIDSAGVLHKRAATPAVNVSGWSVTGNANTSNSNFLGTTDLRPLLIRTNDQLSGVIDPNPVTRNNGLGNRIAGSTVSGSGNNVFGYQAMASLTSGSANTAMGDSAGFSITVGRDNIAFGSKALISAGAGSGNVALGAGALRNSLSSDNIAIGKNAGLNNTSGGQIIAIGTDALALNNTSNTHLVIGNSSLSVLTGGQDNVAVGHNAGLSMVTASYNVLVGQYVLSSSAGANRNTMIGHNAGLAYTGTGNTENTFIGYQAGLSQTGGTGNTFIGANVDVTGNPSPNNSTGIGQDVQITASNQVRIGNTNINSIGGQVGWTTFSDARIKKNVQENVPGLAFISQLRPVTYTYDIAALEQLQGKAKAGTGNSDFENIRFTGLLAQEVEAAASATGFEFSGVDKPANDHTPYGLRYAEFVVPLIKAIQEMKQLIDAQQREIEALKASIKQ